MTRPMRFECDSCQTKYKISDAKVAGRIVRFPCRKCEHRIVIDGRGGEVTVPAGSAYRYEDVTRPSEPVPLVRQGATVRQRRPSSPVRRRPSSVPPRRPSSVARRVSSSPAAASTALVGQHLGLAPPVPPLPQVDGGPLRSRKLDKAEWHVSVNDVPIGPIRLEEMAHKVDAGAVSEYSLVWRDGFDEWRPLATVPELMSLLYERRSSGPPMRSRFSSAPPFVEAQTAIKETPESSPAPGPPKPPVHALRKQSDIAAEFLPLADSLQPEPALPTALGEMSQPAARLSPAPVFESIPPTSAFSGFPATPDERISEPAVPSQPRVVEPRTGSSPWVLALLVAVAVFSGVTAVLAFDKYGDQILEGFFGSPSASIQQAKIVPPIDTPAPGEEVAVGEEGEGVDEGEVTEPGKAAVEETEASDEADPVEGAKVVADAGTVEAARTESTKSTPIIEPPSPTEDGPTMEPVRARRRARAKRSSDITEDPSTGIKKLGDDSLSAEEQKLLADFGSSDSAGVAKIDVAESGSTASKRDPLDGKAVSATVNTNKPRLQRCYERAIRGQQSPTTVRMNVSVNVATSGRVSSVDVAGTGPGGLKECIEASIRRWRFPASSEGGPAKFPIVFSAN